MQIATETEVRFPPFQPAWWCATPHSQTIVGALLNHPPQVAVHRERWGTPDGDFLDLDRLPATAPNAPRLLLLHGLESSSHSNDIRHFMARGQRLGWEVIALNFRSCSGEPNRLARAYHGGDTADLGWVIERLLQEDATRPLGCLGISLGGNVLLKYLGEQQHNTPQPLRCAVAISTTFDLAKAVTQVEQGFSWVYTRRFVQSLKRKTFAKLKVYPDLVDRQSLTAVQTLSEFDDLVTAPIHGFPDAKTYWKSSSSIYFLPQIRRPTLLINAQDDPFYLAEALPWQQVIENDFLIGLFPETGGHAAFIEGGYPFRLRLWAHQQAMFFLHHELTKDASNSIALE